MKLDAAVYGHAGVLGSGLVLYHIQLPSLDVSFDGMNPGLIFAYSALMFFNFFREFVALEGRNRVRECDCTYAGNCIGVGILPSHNSEQRAEHDLSSMPMSTTRDEIG